MLREMLEQTGIAPARAATLLGVHPELFQEWLANQRPMPQSVLSVLSNVVGIDLTPYLERKVPSQEAARDTPAVWYRFRGEELVPEDREFVFLIRRLGYFINELEDITGNKAAGWKALFQEIRQSIDIQAPPRMQGIQAANMFRVSRGLATGADGIGKVLRGNLRTMGVLVIETPVPQSRLEGCCFYVGSRPNERPCVFVNSHHTTWFRRNMVILHEIAHAIFDAESAGAALDFFGAEKRVLAEERADAFAQQVLVPKQVLVHVAQRHGISWHDLSPHILARIVADTHTEKLTVLRAALESELITPRQYEEYAGFDIGSILRSLSTHALSAEEYIRTVGGEADRWLGKRSTTVPSRTLRLPSPYVKGVLEAFKGGEISRGKAAELLMIDDEVFLQRFGEISQALEGDDAHPERNLAFSY